MILYFILLVTTALGADGSLLWGAFALDEPWRLHVAILVAVLTALAGVCALLRNRGGLYRMASVSFSLILFLGIGLVGGGYDHLLPLVLAAHGMANIPASGGFWYAVSGLLLLPLGLGGLATLKYLNPERDIE